MNLAPRLQGRPNRALMAIASLILGGVIAACAGSIVSLPSQQAFRPSLDATPTFATLYRFSRILDGRFPQSVVVDRVGRIFGNAQGGLKCGGTAHADCGVIFEIVRSGSQYSERVLHRFDQGANGNSPTALSIGNDGEVYGATQVTGSAGCGTVFRLAPTRSGYSFNTLYAFRGTDGCAPGTAPFLGNDGRVYGTTKVGGAYGFGSVFALSRDEPYFVETSLFSFPGGGKGSDPTNLISDSNGNLYGEGFSGSNNSIIFELEKTSKGYRERIVHRFLRSLLSGGLVLESDGALYGAIGAPPQSCGIVFRIDPSGAYHVLKNFLVAYKGCSTNSIVLRQNGQIFGVNGDGGYTPRRCTDSGCGTIFQLLSTTAGYDTIVVHKFRGKDGEYPGGLTESSNLLYGITTGGGGRRCPGTQGEGCGTVFRLTP